MVTIQKFAANEWRLYRELRLRALADSPDAFGRTWTEEKDRVDEEWSGRLKEWVASAECHAIYAVADGKPSGLLFARVEHDPKGEALAHLYSMWVDPSVRGCGLGERLVESAVHWSRGRAVRSIELRVTETNAAAIGLYERAGFRRIGERSPLREGSPLFAVSMDMKL